MPLPITQMDAKQLVAALRKDMRLRCTNKPIWTAFSLQKAFEWMTDNFDNKKHDDENEEEDDEEDNEEEDEEGDETEYDSVQAKDMGFDNI